MPAGTESAWYEPAGSASVGRGEDGGQAEPACQRCEVSPGAAVPVDRGHRAGGDGGEYVALQRSSRAGRGGISALRRHGNRDEEPEGVPAASRVSAHARKRCRQPPPHRGRGHRTPRPPACSRLGAGPKMSSVRRDPSASRSATEDAQQHHTVHCTEQLDRHVIAAEVSVAGHDR